MSEYVGEYEHVLCGCDGIHTYCDLCAPIERRVTCGGVCPECALGVPRTHLHTREGTLTRVAGVSHTYTRDMRA